MKKKHRHEDRCEGMSKKEMVLSASASMRSKLLCALERPSQHNTQCYRETISEKAQYFIQQGDRSSLPSNAGMEKTIAMMTTYLMKVLATPFRRIFSRVSIKDCEIPLSTYASKVDNKGVCVLHRPPLTSVVMHADLEGHIPLQMLI